MKQCLLFMLTALLLFTTACSGNNTTAIPTDNEYHPETDWPYYVTNDFGNFNYIQTENGYYFLLDSTLFYTENDAMELIPVCAKPECPHYTTTDDEVETQCNAFFFNSTASNIFNYEDQLYIFHRYYSTAIADMRRYVLTRISADGSRRETVLELDSEWPVMSILHRGVFYIVTQSSNERGMSVAQLWAYPLDNAKKPQLLYETEEQMITHNRVDSLGAYGNYLYMVEFNIDSDIGEIQRLCILDLTSNELTIPKDPEGYTLLQAAISNGRLVRTYMPIGGTNVYKAGEEKPNLDAPMLVSELNGSNAEQLSYDAWGKLAADDTFIYLQSPQLVEEHEDGSRTSSVSTDILYFYDENMNLLDKLPLEVLTYNDILLDLIVYPTRSDRILLFARQGGTMITLYYINRSEIGTGNIRPVEFHSYQWFDYGLGGNATAETD